ncbi:hypothetical protein PR202_ga24996 [Eleusine coracana subsp. coracana]|uniref:Uncharacterized protein n=1 Tax=Eleusine coracana subsp. coracana TaxID=191504 RepID=A0AAV5D9T2_ELECO|nr:hypothetical protein PR202_ga24996 [Eleusine coracana subsp. coracana]
MGNVHRCFKGEEDHAGGDHYPYYRPTSRPHYQPPHDSHGLPSAAPPRPHQQALGPHVVTAATAGIPALDQYTVNFKSTSMVTYSVRPAFFPIPFVSLLCLSI